MNSKQNHNKKVPKRNPLEDTLTISLPKRLKRSLMGRGKLLDRTVSQLVRYALEFEEGHQWKNIPHGLMTPGQERVLKEWLDSGLSIDEL